MEKKENGSLPHTTYKNQLQEDKEPKKADTGLCWQRSSSQGYGFSSSHVWMWELDNKEGWALKNWCFRTVLLEKTLRVPWTARRSNQSILKEISPEYSLEGLMLKLKLQYFGHLMQRTDSFEKTMMLGKIEGRRRRGNRRWDGWLASSTQWRQSEQTPGDSDGQGSLLCCSPWGRSQTWLNDWTTTKSLNEKSKTSERNYRKSNNSSQMQVKKKLVRNRKKVTTFNRRKWSNVLRILRQRK